jgi:hypothetical protein
MAKPRGYPDRRGMGAQSDFISETFVPSKQHEQEQVNRAKALISGGAPLLVVARMLSVSSEWLSEQISRTAAID